MHVILLSNCVIFYSGVKKLLPILVYLLNKNTILNANY